jgi:hypothetical protein
MHLERHSSIDRLKLQVGLRPAGGEHRLGDHPSQAAYRSDNQGGFNAADVPLAQSGNARADQTAKDGHQAERIDNASRRSQRLSQARGEEERRSKLRLKREERERVSK